MSLRHRTQSQELLYFMQEERQERAFFPLNDFGVLGGLSAIIWHLRVGGEHEK